MLPIKRSRDHGQKDTLEQLKLNKSHGVLVSRLSETYKIPEGLQETCFFPEINYRHGGFCLIYAKNQLELQYYKSLLKRDGSMHETDFLVSNHQGIKNLQPAVEKIKMKFEIFTDKYKQFLSDFNANTINRRILLSLVRELCEKIKKLSEKLILEFQDDIILAFYNFLNDENNNCDWDHHEYSRKVFFSCICFMQSRIYDKNFADTFYFLKSFNGIELIQKFSRMNIDEKVYTIDILFQLIFLKKPFNDEEDIYDSVKKIDFCFNLFKIKGTFKSKLASILMSFNQRYFGSISIEIYQKQVENFINSIKIIRLSSNLDGMTLMNSTVVINNFYLIQNQSSESFYNFQRNSSESEENIIDEKPEEVLMEENTIGKEKFLGPEIYVLMTSIHEFGHYIQRSRLSKICEWFSFKTPRNFLSDLSNQHIHQNRLLIEGGKMLITKIFGFEVKKINHQQGLFILNENNWHMNNEEFRQNYLKLKSEKNPPHLNSSYPIRCKTSSDSNYVVFKECGTSSGSKWSRIDD